MASFTVSRADGVQHPVLGKWGRRIYDQQIAGFNYYLADGYIPSAGISNELSVINSTVARAEGIICPTCPKPNTLAVTNDKEASPIYYPSFKRQKCSIC
jgi:hypothetical protein